MDANKLLAEPLGEIKKGFKIEKKWTKKKMHVLLHALVIVHAVMRYTRHLY